MQCKVFGHSNTQCSKKLPPIVSHPNQEWIYVGNGKQKNESTKHPANNPQIVLEDSEDELEQVLVSIVSTSQATLILPQNKKPNHQLSAQDTAIPAKQEDSLEEIINHKELESLSQQMPSTNPVRNGSFEVVDGNNKGGSSVTQQTIEVTSSPAAPISRLAAKKAAKKAVKLKDKEPPDPDIKLMGNSSKAGQIGKLRSSTKGPSTEQGSNHSLFVRAVN